MQNAIKQLTLDWLKKKFLSPFSNRVTKVLLFTGAAIVATPLTEHLILNVILKKIFEVDLGISVPDTKAYIAGIALMVTAALHNIAIEYFKSKANQNIEKPKPMDDPPFNQKSWQYIQKLYNLIRLLPDRYISIENVPEKYHWKGKRQADLKLKESLISLFSEFKDYYFDQKPFQDQKIINNIGEIIEIIKFEVEDFYVFVERIEKQNLPSNFSDLEASAESKRNVSRLFVKIREMEGLLMNRDKSE